VPRSGTPERIMQAALIGGGGAAPFTGGASLAPAAAGLGIPLAYRALMPYLAGRIPGQEAASAAARRLGPALAMPARGALGQAGEWLRGQPQLFEELGIEP
jgi:hypothetical protein